MVVDSTRCCGHRHEVGTEAKPLLTRCSIVTLAAGRVLFSLHRCCVQNRAMCKADCKFQSPLLCLPARRSGLAKGMTVVRSVILLPGNAAVLRNYEVLLYLRVIFSTARTHAAHRTRDPLYWRYPQVDTNILVNLRTRQSTTLNADDGVRHYSRASMQTSDEP